MNIVFRVDASLQIGTGHVMRCLTLAKVLKKNGANVSFICRKHKGHSIDKIRSNGFNVTELDNPVENQSNNKLIHSNWLGATSQQDAKECANVLQIIQPDWLIVDHYAIDEIWQLQLKETYKKIMIIDDLADRKHSCDVLLDQTYGRQQEDYLELVPKDCQLLLGSKYALLRPEFAKWRGHSLERRSSPEFNSLFINMGGIDVDNITAKVLKQLKTCALPSDINIIVVMGRSAPHLENVLIVADALPYKTEVKVDVGNMAEIMTNVDIAVGAAGTTTWERCCLGLPTIQIIIAKNQTFSAKALVHHNAVKLLKEIKEIVHLLENPAKWMGQVGRKASKICDGTGVYKVFNKMTDCKKNLEKFGDVELCNYVNLDTDDKAMVLNMRNHPQINKWMHNKHSISKSEHSDFIESLENDTDRRYFLVKHQKNIIGSINFSHIDLNNSVEFGIYTNPFLNQKGMGGILEAAVSYYAFIELGVNKLKLEVFSNNETAINFYKKCGFKLIDIKKVNHQNIMNMEKKHLREKHNERLN